MKTAEYKENENFVESLIASGMQGEVAKELDRRIFRIQNEEDVCFAGSKFTAHDITLFSATVAGIVVVSVLGGLL